MAYPILAAKNTWWAPTVSTVKSTSITEIELMDSYTPDASVTVVDSWDASAAKDGSITCYVIGTKLIIAGNGSGKIAANEDSYRCFCPADRFTSVIEFTSIELLDISNATNVSQMFNGCSALTSIDLSSWNPSSATNLFGIFASCTALTSLDLTNWDVSNAKDISGLFMSCTALHSIAGMDKWDVSNATDISYMFFKCNALTSIDLSNWNTSNVSTLEAMFLNCFALTSVDLSNWVVSKVVNMSRMFYGCLGLVTITGLSNWDVSNVTTTEVMFAGCTSLTTVGDLSNWDVSNVINMTGMFNACSSLVSIGNLSNWSVSNVTDMAGMFENCPKLTGIGDLANWDTSSVTDMSFMFWGASSIKEIDVSKWDVSKVTNIDHFAAHAGLRRKGIENWKTTSLINANAAFHNCAEEELDLSGWDVSKVQFFCQMFENSPNLKRIKGLEKWNTSAGLGFDGMFERCSKLEELDLSSFDTSKAKNGVDGSTNGHKTATLNNMFLSCNNLKKVKVGPNFSINGNGSNTTAANKAILPTPSTDYIEGADGMWYAFNGEPHAPNAIKDKTAETYFASYALCADQDIIVKNGSMIDAAKAIREKNGTTDHYTPAQFGAAIRALN